MEADGTIAATVHVMAENAEYVSVDENPVIPSSGWQPFQESVRYVFKDSDQNVPRDLYIYVRDTSNNVKGVTLAGIQLPR